MPSGMGRLTDACPHCLSGFPERRAVVEFRLRAAPDEIAVQSPA